MHSYVPPNRRFGMLRNESTFYCMEYAVEAFIERSMRLTSVYVSVLEVFGSVFKANPNQCRIVTFGTAKII